MSDKDNFSWDDEDWTRDFKRKDENQGNTPQISEAAPQNQSPAPQTEGTGQTPNAEPGGPVVPQIRSAAPQSRESALQNPAVPQIRGAAPGNPETAPQGQTPIQNTAPQTPVPPTVQNTVPQRPVNPQNPYAPQQGYAAFPNQAAQQNRQNTMQGQVPPNKPPVPPQGLYQQTPPQGRKRKEKKVRNGKPSFGVTLLKVIAIAAVFGIVAGCIFEATVYFVGDKLGLRTAEVIESSLGLEGPGAEEPGRSDPEALGEAPSSTAANITSVVTSDVTEVVEKAIPSIVAITNISTIEYSNFWGQRGTYEAEGAGSGVIIEKDEANLYILTNNHVVQGTDSNTVQFVDGETAPAEIVGESESRDIAVLSVALENIPAETLPVISVAVIGDSTALKVGEPAIAIGNALGYGQSVTVGVISALEREVSAQDENGNMITNNCIQTDAAINPGNSGGALLNAAGEVVGINEIKFARTEIEGISYAIPMATIEPVMRRIIAREDVTEGSHAFLGVQGIDVTPDIGEHYNMPVGVYIAQVVEDTAAEKAGIYAGDIITAVNGEKITTNEELQQVIGSYAPGTTVTITIMRTNRGVYEELEITATLGSRNDG
ncbi:MAG: trypsin-like peptidase domain-containing protein [Lachnospiraceae bacterium]|nr:trypsin-like peptidase domain-containing protein [Lachnospiraceae bacterium]